MRNRVKWICRKSGLTRWVREEDAMAAVEAGLLFPVMFTMMVGMIDLGNGIMAAQKTIRASQVVADLVARKRSVSDYDIEEAIEAGKLALEPYDTSDICVNVTSVRFLADNEVEQVFQDGDPGCANQEAIDSSSSLGTEGEGAVIVSVKYTFVPWFVGIVIDEIPLAEVAFARGRKSAVVEHD